MHQKTVLGGSKCNIFPGEREYPLQDPPPLGRFANSQFSSEVRSLRFSTPPPLPKIF